MKKLSLFASAAVFAGSLATGIAAHAAAAQAPASVTVQGEVLDLNCYLTQGAHGSDHAMCAKDCLKDGAPAGLLTADGSVYLLAGHSKAYAKIRKLGADTVSVTGEKISKYGLNAIIVEKVAKVKAA